jgi:ABC-type lipoprotein release transport system permease subunit
MQRQTNPSANLRWVLRTHHPERVQRSVVAALRTLDSRIAVEFRTMRNEALSTINRERLLAWVGGLFAALGLVIAVMGIYATFAYAVIRRRAEIGVRLVLGAQPRQVLHQFMREAGSVVLVGAAVGVVTAAT